MPLDYRPPDRLNTRPSSFTRSLVVSTSLVPLEKTEWANPVDGGGLRVHCNELMRELKY